MSDARQLERGNVIHCQLKPAKKPGMWFGSNIKAVKPATMDEIAQGGADEIPL